MIGLLWVSHLPCSSVPPLYALWAASSSSFNLTEISQVQSIRIMPTDQSQISLYYPYQSEARMILTDQSQISNKKTRGEKEHQRR